MTSQRPAYFMAVGDWAALQQEVAEEEDDAADDRPHNGPVDADVLQVAADGELHPDDDGAAFPTAHHVGNELPCPLAPRLHQRKHDLRDRSEEKTSELQQLMRMSYAVFCMKNKSVKTTVVSIRFKHKENML